MKLHRAGEALGRDKAISFADSAGSISITIHRLDTEARGAFEISSTSKEKERNVFENDAAYRNSIISEGKIRTSTYGCPQHVGQVVIAATEGLATWCPIEQ